MEWQSYLTCPACQEKGVIGINESIEGCDAYRWLGHVGCGQLPCMKCKGAGVATVKQIDGGKG